MCVVRAHGTIQKLFLVVSPQHGRWKSRSRSRERMQTSSGLPQLRSLLRLLSFSHCPPDFPRPQGTSRSYIWTSSSMKLTGNIPTSSLRQLGPFTMQESSALLCKTENRFYRSDDICVFLLTLVKSHTTSDRLRIE